MEALVRVWRRVARALVPGDLIARHGEEMERDFRDLLREARGRGRGALLLAALREMADLARAAPGGRGAGAAPVRGTFTGAGRGGGETMDGWLREVRLALRGLLRRPGFTLVALASLAVGIGGATAMFALVDGVLLRPLAYRQPERLVQVFLSIPSLGWERGPVSFPLFDEWRSRGRDVFESLSAFQVGVRRTLAVAGEPTLVTGAQVSGETFATLGREALHGRTLAPADEGPGREPVVVLSHALWTESFGADPSVLGRRLELGSVSHTVVGIMPADFPGLQPGTAQPERFWIPFAAGPASFERDMSFLRVLGRLRAEVDPEVALLAMESVAREQEREDPLGIEGRLVRLVPQAEVVTGNVRTQLLVLLGAVFLLLAIACANLAGLLLVRGAARGRELALREALGAGRRRLVAQLLVESLLLAGLGALLAVPLAWTLLRGVSALGPQGLPRLGEVALDPRALLFCALAALGSALAFGLLPALRATGADPRARLAEGTGASGPTLLQRALVTGQVAMATVLLVGAGLLGTSLLLLEGSDTGFDVAGTLTFRVSPPAGLGPDELAEFQARVLEGTGALPGVKAAGASWALPLGGMYGSGGFLVEGGAGAAGGSRSEYTLEIVPILGGYLDAMGMRLLSGRAFQPGDGDQAETPILVSATLAARAWPGEDALGKRLLEEEDGEIEATYRVVGVVADVTLRGPGAEPELLAYLPQEATPWATDLFYVARTGGDPEALVAGVREVVRRVDDRVPLADVGTMDARLARHLAAPRFRTLLVLLFAAAAGSLSLLGIYGVTSFAVGRRTREIGVRVALGAERGRVLLGVMGDGLRLAALGALLGVLGAAALARTVESLLYGVAPLEPSVYLAVATLVLAAAALATWLPARRAASVSPTVALRVE